jgi:hypothetical protein
MWKKITALLLCFVVGLIVGAFAAWFYTFPNSVRMMFFLQEGEIAQLEDVVVEAYHNEPNDVAIWALETYVDALNRIVNDRIEADADSSYLFLTPDTSFIFAHTRLGYLYQQMGDPNSADFHFKQALYYSDKLGWDCVDSPEVLLEIVEKLDNSDG